MKFGIKGPGTKHSYNDTSAEENHFRSNAIFQWGTAESVQICKKSGFYSIVSRKVSDRKVSVPSQNRIILHLEGSK